MISVFESSQEEQSLLSLVLNQCEFSPSPSFPEGEIWDIQTWVRGQENISIPDVEGHLDTSVSELAVDWSTSQKAF